MIPRHELVDCHPAAPAAGRICYAGATMGCTKGLGAWAAAVTLVIAIGCGGKAIVDEHLGTGGQGGDDGSPLCATPEPNGSLYECGSSTSSGSGSCSTILCDSDGKGWESSCSGNACNCNFNHNEVNCTCVQSGGGSFCDGVTPSCCPAPFPP